MFKPASPDPRAPEHSQIALRLENIYKIYPGTVALHKVNLAVHKGEVHGIIGKNGAGKSTLVGIIAGMIEPTGGTIHLEGVKFTALDRQKARQHKIAIVPQEPQVILDSTVAENLFIPDYPGRGRFINWQRLYARAGQLLKEAGLRLDPRSRAGDLTISERQLLLVVKACYVEQARIIIMDETSASLSQDDEKLLYGIIEERKRQGVTILFISHRVDELLKVCDRGTVIRDGRSSTTRACRELDREKLSTLIVGEDFQLDGGRHSLQISRARQETVLTVEGLTRFGYYKDISFSLKKGEVLGLAGLRGSGRTEILKGLAGIEPAEAGRVTVGKTATLFNSPAQAFKNGIVYLPEDREHEGLIGIHSVRENLVLNALGKFGPWINKKREKSLVHELIDALGIVTASPEQEVGQLSGGNKQKVVVGRIMATRPVVFLLDEPTRGIDIAAKESILKTVKERLTAEAGIIITSPGLEDLLMICDRILVLYRGSIIGQYAREEFSEGELYLAVQGAARNRGQTRDLHSGDGTLTLVTGKTNGKGE